MKGVLVFISVILFYCVVYTTCEPLDDPWAPVSQVLQDGVDNGAFPGCVAIVGDESGIIYQGAFGSFTYGIPPPANDNNPSTNMTSIWDMASCTKVVAGTTAIAQFYQRGEVSLDDYVIDILGPAYGANGKDQIMILNLLLHNAGYPPDPNPDYYFPQFGCPDTLDFYPPETFSCQNLTYQSLLNQTLMYPTGSEYIYSDLSFITMMYVVGTIAKELGYVSEADLVPGCDQGGPGAAQCYFEAYVREFVFSPLDLQDSMYLPPESMWGRIHPTNNDTTYRHNVVQGVVNDPNTYAMGGISGHAGLFTTAPDMSTFMHRLMFAASDDTYLNSTTMALFTKEYNHSQSSRALGWNTNDPSVWDYGWNLTCGTLSPTTWMHIGYTGTQLCGDPVRQIYTIFLTNRVYPVVTNELIMFYRQWYNTAVQKVYDSMNEEGDPVYFEDLLAMRQEFYETGSLRSVNLQNE